jgi:uncharacterized membrane protein YphA (DoxX/SURF4 family)
MANSSADVFILHPALATTGRVLFTLIFFASGVTHFTDLDSYVALMPAAIPFRAFWVVVSALVELAGATLILFNRYPRLGAWLIVVFLIPVTIVVHGYLLVTVNDPQMQQIQASFFLKGVTMAAAALLITQIGVESAVRR